MAYEKVLGTDNPADLMTKHLSLEVVERHSSKLGVEFPSGRAETAPALHNIQCTRALWQEEEDELDMDNDADLMLAKVQQAVNSTWVANWKRYTKHNARARNRDTPQDRDHEHNDDSKRRKAKKAEERKTSEQESSASSLTG